MDITIRVFLITQMECLYAQLPDDYLATSSRAKAVPDFPKDRMGS